MEDEESLLSLAMYLRKEQSNDGAGRETESIESMEDDLMLQAVTASVELQRHVEWQ